MRSSWPYSFILITLLGMVVHAEETITCPASRDTWISSAPDERDFNMGKAPRIKLKGYQEFGILDFDVSALKGRKILTATLFVAPAEGRQFAPAARGTDLRWFTVSTVSNQWVEGNSTQYATDPAGAGATFNQASYKKIQWAYPGSKVWDVILGNGHTLRCDVDAGEPHDGWCAIPLDSRLVEALVAEASYGLLLMDGSVFKYSNAFIHSRESAKAPYLKVTVGDDNKTAPTTLVNVSATPAPNDAGISTGALKISFTVPTGAFSYSLKLDGQPAPRWQIPFADKAGSQQEFVIEFLEPNKDVSVELAAVSAAGIASEPVKLSGHTSPAIKAPELPQPEWRPHGGTAPSVGNALRVWAFPEVSKLDPLTGTIALEPDMQDASSKNSVWDAASGTIRLAAARGEIAGFQLALERIGDTAGDIKVTLDGLENVKTNLFRTWFVKVKESWQADYAIPLKSDEALTIPAKDNTIPQQKAAALAIDLIVPPDAKVGEQSGTITISAGEGKVTLPFKLRIYGATISNEMHFIPELNCYGGPLGSAGSAKFLSAFKVAHYYRCTINRVPHHHSGNTDDDWTPRVDDKGHVIDWSSFDKNLGPLLDGSAFKDNPRASVPVPVLFLPFNESWPLPIASHYHPGKDIPLEGEDWIPLHNLLAKPPKEAFDQQYKDAFVRCVAEFVAHFEEKGWTHTLMQGFHNNKQYNGSKPLLKNGQPVHDDKGKPVRVPAMTGTAWSMDEPATLLDWQALRFYSQLFHKGTAGAKSAKFIFRADVSRPMWQGSYMDGKLDLMDAGGEAFEMLPLMKELVRRCGMKLTCYAGCNTQDKANHQTTCLILKSYLAGFDGTGPWQSIGGDDALDKGDFVGRNGAADNGNLLIVDGSKRLGIDAVASFRLQAMRNGAQLVELLRLLEAKNGWSRTHSLALVSQLIPLKSEFKQAFTDEAAGLNFGEVNGNHFVQLKEGLLKLLDK